LPAVPRLLAVLIACLALLAAGCGGEDDRSQEAEATPEATEAAPAANEFLPEGCENVEKPAPKDVGTIEQPTEELDSGKTYVATVSTSCGDFEITLDSKRAPITGGRSSTSPTSSSSTARPSTASCRTS
jgi:hypothetical protein